MLHLVRDLIALRRRHSDLTSGAYARLPAPAGAWAWRRGERFAVALNLSDSRLAVAGWAGASRWRPIAPATASRSAASCGSGRTRAS